MANIVNATLNLWIYAGNFGERDITKPDYIIYKERISSEDIIVFEIGELVRDYTDVYFDGSYATIKQSAWVEWQMIRTYDDDTVDDSLVGVAISFNGYGYFEDGINPQLSGNVLISNSTIFHNCDDPSLYLPVLAGDDGATRVIYYDEFGTVIREESVGEDLFKRLTADTTEYTGDTIFLTADMTWLDGESSELTEELPVPIGTRRIVLRLADGTIKTIFVECIDCSKYNPYKVSFLNKFGVVQDIWFDKKRTDNIDITKDTYTKNTINLLSTGVSYSLNEASMMPHNIVGNKRLILNTGYVTEDHNEVIQQLLLTEFAWIHEGDNVIPILPKTSSLTYKTVVNDKLVNFTVEFDYAFDAINNVR
jgi:hypothetical protein